MGASADQPRISPLAPEAWPDEMPAVLAALRPAQPRHPFPERTPGRPKGLNVLGTLARYPALAQAFHTFNGHILFGTSLSPRQRELLVLRVAAVRQATYEWRQHVVLAGDAGITADEVEPAGRSAPRSQGWSPLDAALVRAVDELLAEARVADATWAALAAELDVEQLMDLVFTVGAYDVLAMALRSFGVPLDDDLLDDDLLDISELRRLFSFSETTATLRSCRTSRSPSRAAGPSTTPSWAPARSTTRTRSRRPSTSSSARPSSPRPG